MGTSKVTAEDAIQIYTLALAYLYDARFDPGATAARMQVRQIFRGAFYFSKRESVQGHEGHIALVALCSYYKAEKAWHVEFASGKALIFHDAGKVWEFVEEREANLYDNIARRTRRRTRRRNHAPDL